MASKSKMRSKRRSKVNSLDLVKRNLERGDFKQALKDARVCHRQNSTPEYRCFLEHAYIGRAQQLARNGLVEDSRRIVRELLDLGISEPAVKEGLPEVLLSVGMLDSLPHEDAGLTDAQRDRLRITAADRAVSNPLSAPESMPDIREGALRIRAALEAVERGDESAALECLQDIPRQSPFADWKFFVRGLMAYYRRDMESMKGNWDRLDTDRAAARIAAPLKVVAGATPRKDADGLRPKLVRLEAFSNNRGIIEKLNRIRQFAADHDWRQLLKALRASRQALRELDEDILARLVSCLCNIFIRDGIVDELEEFSRLFDPLPSDPYWNRAKAVACEYSEYCEDDSEQFWRNYLRDLKKLPVFSPAERDLARGLIWLRLADNYVEEASDLRVCRCGADHQPDIDEAEEQAEYAFEQGIKFAPDHAPAYEAAALFQEKSNRPKRAAEIYRLLLHRKPDHQGALYFLARHHIDLGEGPEARKFALLAHKLKPLDKVTRDLLWASHSQVSRELARKGQFDKAREEMAAADRLQPQWKDNFEILAQKAVLELKADDTDAAWQFIESAKQQIEKPAALWLALTIEAVRHGLEWQDVLGYEKRWFDSLKLRCHGESAKLMCNLLDKHTRMLKPYEEHGAHQEKLLGYLARCSRVKWHEDDLRFVCEYLERLDELELLGKFAIKGVRKHPRSGYFRWLAGMSEFKKGPYGCNRFLAVQNFETAIDLLSESNNPSDERILESARLSLEMLDNTDHCLDGYDDEADESFDGGPGNPLDNISLDDLDYLKDKIEEMCGKMGLDSKTVMDELNRKVSGKSRR